MLVLDATKKKKKLNFKGVYISVVIDEDLTIPFHPNGMHKMLQNQSL